MGLLPSGPGDDRRHEPDPYPILLAGQESFSAPWSIGKHNMKPQYEAPRPPTWKESDWMLGWSSFWIRDAQCPMGKRLRSTWRTP